MSAIPSKTGVPRIVDIKLNNTVDFHVAYTNFNTVIEHYINFNLLLKTQEILKDIFPRKSLILFFPIIFRYTLELPILVVIYQKPGIFSANLFLLFKSMFI